MGQQQPPPAPNPAQTYRQGIETYLRYQPTLLAQEQAARGTYDPQRLAEQYALQSAFGPQLYANQLASLRQVDPTGALARQVLGGVTLGELPNIEAQRGLLQGALGGEAGQALGVQDQLRQSLGDELASANAYRAQLGTSLQNQLGAGTQLTPAMQQQAQQEVRAAQAARGNDLGNAASFEEALTLGQRGQQLYQQRVQNMANFLQSPNVQASQYGQIGMGVNPALQAYQGYVQSPDVGLGQLGTFLESPTPESWINQIQPVSPDRSSQYVNPSAGFLGQQFGLANFPNQLAAYNAYTNRPNPWAGALGGAASGALAGATLGSAYPGIGTAAGAVGGGIVGAAGGYFGYSDRRLKERIVQVGVTRNGFRVYEFNFWWQKAKRIKGLMADEVQKILPEAVHEVGGFLAIDYSHSALK